MARQLEVVDLPLTGGGEQTASAPGNFGPGEAWRLENGWIVGRGIVAQVPDWRIATTLTDATGTPPVGGTECDAVIGIFPFAQIGNIGGGATSGAIVFSLRAFSDKIFLHHLSEDGAVLRTVDTSSVVGTWTNTKPPQVTGFEMKGRFYFNWDGRESAASRKGLAYYDPSAGTITKPSVNIEGAGTGALRFKGIALHQGGTILGWGYGTNTDADQPHLMRYNKYTDPDTWIAAIADGDVTAGKFPVGTVSVPIIGCAQSGQYTIIGKEREIFALDGNFSSQFNFRPIGNAHGPISPKGIVSIGDAAVWMSEDGPAFSENGGNVQQLGIDRILRRFLTYFDLTYCEAVHDSLRNRVGWLLKRQATLDGDTVSVSWGDEILWWDYERDLFYVERTPETCYTIGILKGTGQTVSGPAAAPTSLVASGVTTSSASISWTNGDTSYGVTTKLEHRLSGGTWVTASASIGAGVSTFLLTGLNSAAMYDVRVSHYRNGVQSAITTSASLFTTGVVGPSNLSSSGVSFTTATVSWSVGETGSHTTVVEYKRTADGSWTVLSAVAAGVTSLQITGLASATQYDVRVRHVKNGLTSPYATATGLFTTSGSGALAVPTLTTASGTTSSGFTVNWTNGNASLQTRVEYKRTSDSTWTLLGVLSAGDTIEPITGLTESTQYDVRAAHYDPALAILGSYHTVSPYVTTSVATLPPPAAPTLVAASGIGQTGFTVNWTNGVGTGVTTEVEYRLSGAANWTVATTSVAAGVVLYAFTGLSASSVYDVRVRHRRTSDGIYSSYATASSYATTSDPPPSVGTPSNVSVSLGSPYISGNKWYQDGTITWLRGEFSAGSRTEVLKSSVNNFANASVVGDLDSSVVSWSETILVHYSDITVYYWVRHKLSGGALGTAVATGAVTYSKTGA